MTTLSIVTFLWGSSYQRSHVDDLFRGYQLFYDRPFRFICVSDQHWTSDNYEVVPLWENPGNLPPPSTEHPSCYRRLRLFDPDTSRALGLADGAPVLQSDLDVLLTGKVTELLQLDASTLLKAQQVLGGRGTMVLNGSLWLFRAGQLPFLWREFNPRRTPVLCASKKYYGSDQAWLSFRVMAGKMTPPEWAKTWTQFDGVCFYRAIRGLKQLPAGAKIVNFCGKHKHWDLSALRQTPWLSRHWPYPPASEPAS